MLRLGAYGRRRGRQRSSKRLGEPALITVSPLLLLLGYLTFMPGAQAAGHFAKVYASSNKASHTEWGRRYGNGEGVAADVDSAIRLYCNAANQGHADAQYYLGWLYSRGRGVKRDDALAAAWFKKAAGQNHAQARNLLHLLRVKPKAQATCPTSGARQGLGNVAY